MVRMVSSIKDGNKKYSYNADGEIIVDDVVRHCRGMRRRVWHLRLITLEIILIAFNYKQIEIAIGSRA